MSANLGFSIGKVIFDILSNYSSVVSAPSMSAARIQPAPLLDQIAPEAAVIYELSSVMPTNIKRRWRIETSPLSVVDFSIEVIQKNYKECTYLSQAVTQALEQAGSGVYNNVKIDGITLSGGSEGYNRQQRYYTKNLSFSVRVLV